MFPLSPTEKGKRSIFKFPLSLTLAWEPVVLCFAPLTFSEEELHRTPAVFRAFVWPSRTIPVRACAHTRVWADSRLQKPAVDMRCPHRLFSTGFEVMSLTELGTYDLAWLANDPRGFSPRPPSALRYRDVSYLTFTCVWISALTPSRLQCRAPCQLTHLPAPLRAILGCHQLGKPNLVREGHFFGTKHHFSPVFILCLFGTCRLFSWVETHCPLTPWAYWAEIKQSKFLP